MYSIKKREGYSSKKRDSWQVCNNIVCKTSYCLHQAGDLIELCRVIVTPYLCHLYKDNHVIISFVFSATGQIHHCNGGSSITTGECLHVLTKLRNSIDVVVVVVVLLLLLFRYST